MSDQYGVIERRIAHLLTRFPLLKAWAKQGYSRTAYLLSGGRDADLASRAPVHQVGAPSVETFFGYYDKSPLSANGWLLCHAAGHPTNERPRPDRSVAVQVYDFRAGELTRPALSIDTHAYNWQQGARAHWLDGDRFIFNDFDFSGQRYVSRIWSIAQRREVDRHAMPVQDSWQGSYFLSINYRRLQALRPDYGYCNLPALTREELADLDNDGIWRVEQPDGDVRMLYTLRDICRCDFDPVFDHATHKVNHLMVGPDGSQFIFLHRYFIGRRKFDRLMLASAQGDKLRVLSAHGMVSHCFWMNDTTLLCFLRGPEGHDGYHIVDITSGRMRALLEGRLDALGDGHPHVHGHRFITDTYPDKRRMQHLLQGDLHTGRFLELGRFHHGFRHGGETRCDLHPRYTLDGRHVFFDSVCSGRRRLYFLESGPGTGEHP